jgi:hypothetical protein
MSAVDIAILSCALGAFGVSWFLLIRASVRKGGRCGSVVCRPERGTEEAKPRHGGES